MSPPKNSLFHLVKLAVTSNPAFDTLIHRPGATWLEGCPASQNNTATFLPAESSPRTNPRLESVVLLFILCSNPLEPLLHGTVVSHPHPALSRRLDFRLRRLWRRAPPGISAQIFPSQRPGFPPSPARAETRRASENRQRLHSFFFSLNFSFSSTAFAFRTLATGSSSSLARARSRPSSIRSCRARNPGPALQPWPNLPPQPPHADLEALIGGRWFNHIGIIALLFAVSYFLKLAFDNNWIGPAGRVAIGILLGAPMLPWSQWLLSRGYSYFAEGIAGLAEATLFVSVWAGCQYYTLFSRGVGFAALVFVTIVMAALALWRDSSRIAFLSLLGGLLTPALVSSGRVAEGSLCLFSVPSPARLSRFKSRLSHWSSKRTLAARASSSVT